MPNFCFNKLIIIESLIEEKEQQGLTGKCLFEELNVWVPSVHDDKLIIEYIPVPDYDTWQRVFQRISNECESNKVCPILHFEIHGDKDKQGLVLADGHLIPIMEFGNTLRNINVLTGCNLFVTLAVCHGLHTMFALNTKHAAPFCGILGSFNSIYADDLRIRYSEFYSEFFSSLNLDQAYRKLIEANGDINAGYRCYMADDVFLRVYNSYIRDKCNDEALNERAESIVKKLNITDSEKKARYRKYFKNREIRTREEDFNNFKKIFFLTDRYPENEERFNLPQSINELQVRFPDTRQ